MKWTFRATTLALWLLGACTGAVEGAPQAPSDDGAGGGPGSGSGSGSIPSPGGSGGVPSGKDAEGCGMSFAAPRAVLLTPRQYVNVLRDVLGEDAVSKDDAASDDKLEFDTVDLPRMTTATLDHALRLTDRAIEGLRGKSAGLLGCGTASDATCVRSKLGTLARRAFKRPVAADELDELMKIYDTGAASANDGGDSGVLLAVQAIMLAPSTLYRTEFTTPAQSAVRTLSLHERASAISALLLDSAPDEALMAAADDGSLADPKVLDQQLDRLLALPRVRAHVTRLVLSAFKIPKLFETPKDLKTFPDYTPTLQNSMYEETRRFVERVLWQDEPLRELFTSRSSFVDPALAKLYGVPYTGSGEFVPAELPASRSGLLTQASVLSVLARTQKTSVVARGLFVRGALLCLPKIASPPSSIQAQIEEQLEAAASERELADYRARTSPCQGCHAGFDAFGLLLEEFDAIGRHSGKAGQSVDLKGLGGLEKSLAEPTELAREKAEDGAFTDCLTRRTLGYALATAIEPIEPSCGSDALSEDVIARGGTLRDLIAALATSPNFFQRAEEL